MKLPSLPLPSTGWLILAAGIAGAAAAWAVQGWRMGEQIADIRLEASKVALASAIEAKGKTDRMRANMAALDAQKTKELNREKAENERRRVAVAAGTGWLSVNASCPKLPGLSVDPGLGNGTGARLTDAAERNYWLLRERAILCVKQVETLQGALRIERE